jgi:putative addiction module CopG family antidote
MGVTALLSISLTPELERFIEQRVAAGLNQSAEDVVREALLALKMDQRDIDTAFTDLKNKLEDAAKEEQNEGEMTDGDAFISGLLTRLQEPRSSSGAA